MGEWLEQYENLNLGGTKELRYPKELPWIDLKVSLEMILQQAVGCTDDWNDVDRKFNDRRSFPTFPEWLEDSELDWHKYVSKDDELNVSNQLNWLSLQASTSDDMAHLRPELASDSNWVMANKYYDRSLSLMHLLEEIRSKSSNSFSREQAERLSSFLNRLIMIQHEHRVVAYDLYDHLKQLTKSDAVCLLAFSSNAVDDDGDRHKSLCIASQESQHTMWQQKHLFDSLYIMSRESAWLLRKHMDSHLSSSTFVKESQKILESIMLFIPKCKKSKDLLDQYLLDPCHPFIEDEAKQLIQQNVEVLDEFGNDIKDLQEKSGGKIYIIERLFALFRDTVQGKTTVSVSKYCAPQLRGFIFSPVPPAYLEAVEELIKLSRDATETFALLHASNISVGGSLLGTVAYWRILFESSQLNLMLDRICKKLGEALELREKISDENENKDPSVLINVWTIWNLLQCMISSLMSAGDKVLSDHVAIYKTVAEVTYMLGDAFTTGGSGMKDTSDTTSIKMDFPWDKHNVPDGITYDFSNPEIWLLDANVSKGVLAKSKDMIASCEINDLYDLHGGKY